MRGLVFSIMATALAASRKHRPMQQPPPPPSPDEQILSWDARTLSREIREGRVSCVQVMTATLDRLEQEHDHAVKQSSTSNAVVLLRDRSVLLQEAQAADDAVRLDPSSKQRVVGWLHGIPMAVKDLFNCQGLATTMGGSPLYCNCNSNPTTTVVASTVSDPHVQRLQRAGAICIGKTNTPESGLGSHTYNRVFGTTGNAYDPTKSAGGSSGGAAVAVARPRS